MPNVLMSPETKHPYIVVSCGYRKLHLVTKQGDEYKDRTLCGRSWSLSKSPWDLKNNLLFDSKLDCQQCRKVQESLS